MRGVAKLVSWEDTNHVGSHRSTGTADLDGYMYKVVIEVRVPGSAPYEVRKKSLRRPRRGYISGAGYPVLIDADDPDRLEFLYDEMPEARDQVSDLISDAMGRAASAMPAVGSIDAEMVRGWLEVVPPEMRAQTAQMYQDMGYPVPEEYA